jgi:hypothetical protein
VGLRGCLKGHLPYLSQFSTDSLDMGIVLVVFEDEESVSDGPRPIGGRDHVLGVWVNRVTRYNFSYIL